MRMLIKLNYMYLEITKSMRAGWEYVALVHSIIHTEILNMLWMTTGTGGVDKYCLITAPTINYDLYCTTRK